jgi:hypothetical protein
MILRQFLHTSPAVAVSYCSVEGAEAWAPCATQLVTPSCISSRLKRTD